MNLWWMWLLDNSLAIVKCVQGWCAQSANVNKFMIEYMCEMLIAWSGEIKTCERMSYARMQNKRIKMQCFELYLCVLKCYVFCRSRLLKHTHKARLISVFFIFHFCTMFCNLFFEIYCNILLASAAYLLLLWSTLNFLKYTKRRKA